MLWWNKNANFFILRISKGIEDKPFQQTEESLA